MVRKYNGIGCDAGEGPSAVPSSDKMELMTCPAIRAQGRRIRAGDFCELPTGLAIAIDNVHGVGDSFRRIFVWAFA